METPGTPVVRLERVDKRYGGVHALREVDFAAHAGSIHGVLGENGAGKSTLIKIIAGVVQPTSGEIYVDGARRTFDGPQDANDAGIVCIFQELSLLPDLSVADNICITKPPRRLGLIDRRAQMRRAEELLARIGCSDIDPRERVRDLSLSRRQMVEIAKALGRNPRLLILDEATSALTAADVEKVYRILHELRAEGLSLLYISHRMNEIKALCDVCSVFRNGRHIATFPAASKSDEEVVSMLIGREMSQVYPPRPPQPEAPPKPIFEVDRLSWGDRLENISFSVAPGQIVGLGGLDGQGQRELLLALFGVLRGVGGQVRIDGKPMRISGPRMAKSAGGVGVALIPEDRKTEGLILPMSIATNISIASLSGLTRGMVVDRKAEAAKVDEMIAKLRIKIGSADDAVATLSGGNQQKVVIAKWLMTGARIILLNDPTRGIDVGTKQEIYRLLRELAAAGAAIVFYSTDYDELIGCCDQVLILYGGRVVRTLEGDEITETNIVASALNLDVSEPAAAR